MQETKASLFAVKNCLSSIRKVSKKTRVMISNKTEDAIQPPERALSREKLFETEKSDRYHVEVAYNTEEAIRLLEVGFECVTGEYHDGGKIFRKRK